jgi:pheromone alpha factor receptor
MLEAWRENTGKTLVVAGLAIGMTSVVMIIMLLLSRPEKRRTPVFILNLLALVTMFIRMFTVAIAWNGPIQSMSVIFLGTEILVSDTALAANYVYDFVTIIWYFVILASMIFQVRVVFAAETAKSRNTVTAGLGVLAFSVWATQVVIQVTGFIEEVNKTADYPTWYYPLENASHILWAITIGLSSLIFVLKLLYLIHKRHQMGFKTFGPLQIVTIMGAQCLIIPCNSPQPLLPSISLTCSDFCNFGHLRQRQRLYHHR